MSGRSPATAMGFNSLNSAHTTKKLVCLLFFKHEIPFHLSNSHRLKNILPEMEKGWKGDGAGCCSDGRTEITVL